MTAYQVADVWKNFWEIKGFDATDISDVEFVNGPIFEQDGNGVKLTGAVGEKVAVYTTSGLLVDEIPVYDGESITLDNGMYIIRTNKGCAKIYVR